MLEESPGGLTTSRRIDGANGFVAAEVDVTVDF